MEILNGKKIPQQDLQNLLVRVADLVNIEGPLLTLYLHANKQLYLCDWVDRDNNHNRWLLYRTQAATLQQFVEGKISHHDLLFADELTVYKIDIDRQLNWQNGQKIEKKALPNNYLPQKDVFFDKADCPNFARLMAFISPQKRVLQTENYDLVLAY
jgi:hypothetical protein